MEPVELIPDREITGLQTVCQPADACDMEKHVIPVKIGLRVEDRPAGGSGQSDQKEQRQFICRVPENRKQLPQDVRKAQPQDQPEGEEDQDR